MNTITAETFCSSCGKPLVADQTCHHPVRDGEAAAPPVLRGMGGWLLLLTLSATVDAIGYFVGAVAIGHGHSQGVLTVAVIIGLAMSCLFGIAAVKLWMLKPDAKKWVKTALIWNCGLSVFMLIGPTLLALHHIIVSVIWLIYLHKSVRVKNTYQLSGGMREQGYV